MHAYIYIYVVSIKFPMHIYVAPKLSISRNWAFVGWDRNVGSWWFSYIRIYRLGYKSTDKYCCCDLKRSSYSWFICPMQSHFLHWSTFAQSPYIRPRNFHAVRLQALHGEWLQYFDTTCGRLSSPTSLPTSKLFLQCQITSLYYQSGQFDCNLQILHILRRLDDLAVTEILSHENTLYRKHLRCDVHLKRIDFNHFMLPQNSQRL